MNATDLRNANFASLRELLDQRRGAVYAGFQQHGPCTTRHLGQYIGLDVLSVRPRATELATMGLLVSAGAEKYFSGAHRVRETIYRATTREEWEAWHADHFAVSGQLQMADL